MSAVAGVAFLLAAGTGSAQQGGAALAVVQVRPDFYMIAGAGANIGVQIGTDGIVLVNTGTREASGDVLAAIQKLSKAPIRYIINTSGDADVLGGNATSDRGGSGLGLFNGGSPAMTANTFVSNPTPKRQATI